MQRSHRPHHHSVPYSLLSHRLDSNLTAAHLAHYQQQATLQPLVLQQLAEKARSATVSALPQVGSTRLELRRFADRQTLVVKLVLLHLVRSLSPDIPKIYHLSPRQALQQRHLPSWQATTLIVSYCVPCRELNGVRRSKYALSQPDS